MVDDAKSDTSGAAARFTAFAPLIALAVLIAGALLPSSAWFNVVAGLSLIAAVIVAVHHAEVVAHKVGEPFGTLVLALAVTVIEVALILSLMLSGGADKAVVPRDTIYAAVMIICNGVVGACVLVGGIHHHEQSFHMEGARSGIAALISLATLSLVVPVFTTSSPEGTYNNAQLAFVAVMSLVLWLVFVFIQTVRHRDYFLPAAGSASEDEHAPPPNARAAWKSFGLMVVALVAVVGLAKLLSPVIEAIVRNVGAPQAVIGIAIALLVLAPETTAALRAARSNRLQTSLNLAIGSALASIGLTIPAVVVAAIALDLPLVLGLGATNIALMALTFVVTTLTLGSGRTTLMQGAIHLVLFAAFLFLSLVP
ncbi:MAG TPA: ionic transporter y4hA [Casimicrobiaceae bacterium]|nr:ionic transporter y4hA [Casimicrobiaceae bacterium]